MYRRNRPSLPLIDIVSFSPLNIIVSLTILKHVYQGEVFARL